MRYSKVHVRRSETTSATIFVAPWEVPLLEFVHPGQEGVEVTGFEDREHNDYPEDLGAELARLHSVYRGAPDSKGETVSVVDAVYGAGSLGMRRLGEEIERAKADEAKAKKSGKKAASKADAEKDPLAA